MTLIVNKHLIAQKKYIIILTCLGIAAVFMWISLSAVAAVYSPSRTMGAQSKVSANVVTQDIPTIEGNDKAPSTIVNKSATVTTLSDCMSSQPRRPTLASATSPQLRKLAQYEQACDSGIITRMSFFVATPTTIAEANKYAQYVAKQLREFATHNVSPVVFFEPTSSTGLVDLKAYRDGTYDSALDTYFAAIKARGITDAMMGTWVPLPEGNLPVWTSVDPNIFAACVTKAVTYQKKHFPGSSASILLDTDTYPVSGSWVNGRPVSLLPYVKSIPYGLIDSVGLQGLPWSPAKNEGGTTNGAPNQYLRADLLTELAHGMNIKDVWLNTGSFGVKYANQPGRQVTVKPEQRHVQLTGVVGVVKTLQAQGLAVSVHLFAENKSDVPEATDWSYWPNGKAASSSSTIVFKTFVRDLQAANVSLWLFDI
jgi:hypothetical protein